MMVKRKHRTKNKKQRLIETLGEECVYCNCKTRFMLSLDHKISLSRGGEDEEKNLQTVCFICNKLKGNMTHIEFKKYLRILGDLKDWGKLRILGSQLQFQFIAEGLVIKKNPNLIKKLVYKGDGLTKKGQRKNT